MAERPNNPDAARVSGSAVPARRRPRWFRIGTPDARRKTLERLAADMLVGRIPAFQGQTLLAMVNVEREERVRQLEAEIAKWRAFADKAVVLIEQKGRVEPQALLDLRKLVPQPAPDARS